MSGRAHLTIGEVLTLLREEFPDVSISKIRFLESQGLVDPERTPSGYRKFYEHDVERLRWILLQQREHFLPLKVIRGRLDQQERGGSGGSVAVASAAGAPARLFPDADPPEPPSAPARVAADPGAAPRPPAVPGGPPPAPRADRDPRPATGGGAGAAGTATRPAPGAGHDPRAGADMHAGPATVAVDRESPSRARPADQAAAPMATPPAAGQRPPEQPDVYTAEELASAAGCDPQLVRDLQQYGLLTANGTVGGVAYFDPAAVRIARVASGFAAVGVEPRHLRTWRNAAEREASLYEQLVMPLLRQRNPQARRQAAELLDRLASLGGELRDCLVHEAVRDIR